MEILVATFAMFSYLFSGTPVSANNVPYVLIQEYQTNQECQLSIIDTDDICMTEPDQYHGTRQYSKVPLMHIADVSLKIEPNSISGIDRNVCNHISGCAVDPSAMTEEEYCPTCSQSKWYLMND